MRRNTVRAQLAVFGTISVLIIAYTVFGLLGVNITGGPFTVRVHLARAGGIYQGAEVAFRGVQVGRVGTVDLRTDGVDITLEVNDGTHIPDNAIAHVYDLSPVGEQYVDLVPQSSSTSYLHNNSEIPQLRTTTPPETATVIFDLERFVDSINPRDLQVIGREGAIAFANTGVKLKSILNDTTDIIDQLSSSEDSMIHLLDNASVLLHGAAAHSGEFDKFASSLNALTTTLAAKTPALNKLLQQAGPTTRLVDSLVADNASATTVLLGNLATLSDIQSTRVPGLRSLLVAVPEFARLAPTVVHDGTLLGAANINQDQRLCNTGLPLTSPISGKKTPLHAVGCDASITRGAANAPRPAGDSSGVASSSSAGSTPLGASARTTSDGTQVGSYDAGTGLVSTADGKLVRLGTNGGQVKLLGGNSWLALLLAGTGS